MTEPLSIEQLMGIRQNITQLNRRKRKLEQEIKTIEFKICDLQYLYEDLLLCYKK